MANTTLPSDPAQPDFGLLFRWCGELPPNDDAALELARGMLAGLKSGDLNASVWAAAWHGMLSARTPDERARARECLRRVWLTHMHFAAEAATPDPEQAARLRDLVAVLR